jgi:hypothetical protein
MRITAYIILILALFTSCKNVETKSQPKEQNSNVSKRDSITENDFGEHESIHQQEWEEHQIGIEIDTISTFSN